MVYMNELKASFPKGIASLRKAYKYGFRFADQSLVELSYHYSTTRWTRPDLREAWAQKMKEELGTTDHIVFKEIVGTKESHQPWSRRARVLLFILPPMIMDLYASQVPIE